MRDIVTIIKVGGCGMWVWSGTRGSVEFPQLPTGVIVYHAMSVVYLALQLSLLTSNDMSHVTGPEIGTVCELCKTKIIYRMEVI